MSAKIFSTELPTKNFRLSMHLEGVETPQKGDAGKDNNEEVADGPCNDERSHDASSINEALAANSERYKRRIDILIAGNEKL